MLVNLVDVSMLKERERQRRQLITFLSHDLRSPLASILAITSLAKLKEAPLSAKDLENIEQNANKTLRLADDFLQLARAEYIEPTVFSDVDIVPLAESALASVSGYAKGKNTTITHQLCDAAMVCGDSGLLERVMTNLLSNAIKYSPESSQVEFGIEAVDGKIHCWVRDNGIGMPEDELPKIFDSFHRVSGQNHKEKGSGVGLSFIKTVVDRHSGTIDVESELGKGSCFHLYFPGTGPDED
jgi:signal transduction histidine kinase